MSVRDGTARKQYGWLSRWLLAAPMEHTTLWRAAMLAALLCVVANTCQIAAAVGAQ